MKKKVALGLIFAAGIMSLLAGCGNKPSDTEIPEETETITESGEEEITLESGPVELTMWSEAANFDLLNTMIENFKAEHAGEVDLKVNLVENADANIRENVLNDVHNAPDIFVMVDDQLTDLVGGGALHPVENQEEVKQANLEDAVAAASVGDTLYAYPMTADNGYFLYYDKKYLSDVDVQTLDGILTVAAANEKKFTMDWSSGWYLYAFFGGTGLDFGINEDGITNHCNWNTAEGDVKGVDIAQAMLTIAAHPGFQNCLDAEFLEGVKNGSAIAGVSGVWNAVEIQQAWGKDYGAVKLPTYTCAGKQIQMSSFKGYKMLGVNYYSKQKGWALKLADYLTNEENQKLRLEVRNQGPSNKNVASSELVGSIPAIQAVIAQAEYGKLQRVGNSYWNPFMDFGEMMAAGNLKGMELQEVMDMLVAGITASTVQ
ncbi:MAG: extracellular solute-binding protein [Lachnospiraceae bacterium]|nr:extracellular solute-binding protein [Lachnospiraceae bacterium]